MSQPRVVVTFTPSAEMRQALDGTLGPVAEVMYLAENPGSRAQMLSSADVVLAWSIDRELSGRGELELIRSVGLIQLLSAGVDHVPFGKIPRGVPVASNAGAYADPMAEHVLAMTLALAKRLPENHAALARGVFDQETPTRSIRGSVAGILGFGGIGQASARLFRALEARIHAVNRSGQTSETVDWIAGLDELDTLLAASDFLVVSLPLTRSTRGLIGSRELSLMKPDATLVNVARAAILDEDALYEHLRANPGFSAGIDTWWQEPRGSGAFATRHPFLELPNVIGSPHNSAITSGSLTVAVRQAAENVARHLGGQPARHIVDPADYVE